MDAVYFWRKYCYVVFRSWELRKNLLWYKVPYETNYRYKKWIEELTKRGWDIIAIVSDWRRWLLGWFWKTPTQMCIFHQKMIIRRYISKNPILEPNKELKEIGLDVWKWSRKTFERRLDDWYKRNNKWLMEKNEEWGLIHERTHKAYRSLKNNMTYLYTFEKYPKLSIPQTNNSLEAINSHLKTKTRIHRGLTEERKCKIIEYYLYIS